MLQIAIFVDAGYLYSQGSKLLTGNRQPQELIGLEVPLLLKQFLTTAEQVAPGIRLLRIYWYDGLPRGGIPSQAQNAIANSHNVKLRLGTLNNKGEQKGVDSLIVTDLIDLARNQAISDALLLSGDEDIRIGVQIAQTFGVRIHLLGIKPAFGSQSSDLLREADTHHEWNENILNPWMRTRLPPSQESSPISSPSPCQPPADASSFTPPFEAVLAPFLEAEVEILHDLDKKQYQEGPELALSTIPPELDRPTLAKLRNHLGRDLTDEERKKYRVTFASMLRDAVRPSRE